MHSILIAIYLFKFGVFKFIKFSKPLEHYCNIVSPGKPLKLFNLGGTGVSILEYYPLKHKDCSKKNSILNECKT